MAQHTWRSEDEASDVTYSMPHLWQGEERRPVGAWRGTLPVAVRRALSVVLLAGLLALGMQFGLLAPGPALASLIPFPTAGAARQGMSTPLVVAAAPGGEARVTAALAPDARFAIATLGIHCLLSLCDAVQHVAAGLRVYPVRAGVSCTTTSAVTVVGQSERFVYCRLDQPNVFAYTFDGAQFDCVGAQLGCHNVVIVDTTNGRQG
jgi:hypothetical protein